MNQNKTKYIIFVFKNLYFMFTQTKDNKPKFKNKKLQTTTY